MHPLGLLILIIGLVACSRDKQDPDPSDAVEKQDKEPLHPPSSGAAQTASKDTYQACESKDGTAYPLKISGQDICVIHNDSNGDGVVQLEGITLQVEGKSISQDHGEFKKFQQQYALPQFRGLDIAKWHKFHQSFFNPVRSAAPQKYFERLQSYCQEKGVDFSEASMIAHQMVKSADPYKSKFLNALTIASLLLGIQNQKIDGFYNATNRDGRQDNKEYIDTVLVHLRQGHLTIKTDLEEGGMALGGNIGNYYRATSNAVVLSGAMDIYDERHNGTIIHELYHFYQDSQELGIAVLDMEWQAYLKQGEYIIAALGVTTKQDKMMVEAFLFSHRIFGKIPSIAAVWLAYYQRINDAAGITKWSQRLKRVLVSAEFIDPALERDFHIIQAMVDKTLQRVAENPQERKQALIQADQMALKARREYDALRVRAQTARLKKTEVEDKMLKLIQQRVYGLMLRLIFNFSVNEPGKRKADVIDTGIDQLIAELADLQPTAYIYRDFDGVMP